MNFIVKEAKSHIRDKICAELNVLDLRGWSRNGHYPHRRLCLRKRSKINLSLDTNSILVSPKTVQSSIYISQII